MGPNHPAQPWKPAELFSESDMHSISEEWKKKKKKKKQKQTYKPPQNKQKTPTLMECRTFQARLLKD